VGFFFPTSWAETEFKLLEVGKEKTEYFSGKVSEAKSTVGFPSVPSNSFIIEDIYKIYFEEPDQGFLIPLSKTKERPFQYIKRTFDGWGRTYFQFTNAQHETVAHLGLNSKASQLILTNKHKNATPFILLTAAYLHYKNLILKPQHSLKLIKYAAPGIIIAYRIWNYLSSKKRARRTRNRLEYEEILRTAMNNFLERSKLDRDIQNLNVTNELKTLLQNLKHGMSQFLPQYAPRNPITERTGEINQDQKRPDIIKLTDEDFQHFTQAFQDNLNAFLSQKEISILNNLIRETDWKNRDSVKLVIKRTLTFLHPDKITTTYHDNLTDQQEIDYITCGTEISKILSRFKDVI
jgi:hypothetical protein